MILRIRSSGKGFSSRANDRYSVAWNDFVTIDEAVVRLLTAVRKMWDRRTQEARVHSTSYSVKRRTAKFGAVECTRDGE